MVKINKKELMDWLQCEDENDEKFSINYQWLIALLKLRFLMNAVMEDFEIKEDLLDNKAIVYRINDLQVLKNKSNDNSPIYNKLYKVTLFSYDPWGEEIDCCSYNLFNLIDKPLTMFSFIKIVFAIDCIITKFDYLIEEE